MQAKYLILLILLSMLGMNGCSSYQNSSSCPMVDNYGKCINVEDAYTEAVTGQSRGLPIKKKSLQKQPSKNTSTDNDIKLDEKNQLLVFENYQVRNYKELIKQLDDPKHPLLLPPKIVRTLILSYSNSHLKDKFFMPRFVYSIVQDARWIGDQNSYTDNSAPSSNLADSRQLAR